MAENDVVVVRDPAIAGGAGGAASEASVVRRVSWPAIFAGAVVGLGLWVLLYALGLAMGLTSLDPNDPGSARGAGIGTGVWSLIAPLVALFLGGFLAARLAAPLQRGAGAAHGAVIWGLTTIGGLLLVGSLLSAIVGGTARLGAKTVAAAGGVATGAAGLAGSQAGGAASALGIGTDDLVAPLNEQLKAQGKPPVTAEQLQAVVRDVAPLAVRGDLDRERLVTAISQRTALTRQDAEGLAGQMEQRFQSLKAQGSQKLDQLGQTVQDAALQAGDTTGKVMWGVFGALFLGLLAALGGGAVGAAPRDGGTRFRRRVPVGQPAEVHP